MLPVDAHPALMLRPDNGKVWRPRIQSYDATFGLDDQKEGMRAFVEKRKPAFRHR